MLNKQRLKNIVLAVFAVLFLLVLYTNFSDRPSIFSLINNRFLASHGGGHIEVVTGSISPKDASVINCTNGVEFSFVVDNALEGGYSPGQPILALKQGGSLIAGGQCASSASLGDIEISIVDDLAADTSKISCDYSGITLEANTTYQVVFNGCSVYPAEAIGSCNAEQTFTFTCDSGSSGPVTEFLENVSSAVDETIEIFTQAASRFFDNSWSVTNGKSRVDYPFTLINEKLDYFSSKSFVVRFLVESTKNITSEGEYKIANDQPGIKYSFALQYANNNGNNCSAATNWKDVTVDSAIAYFGTKGVGDNIGINPSTYDPDSDVYQSHKESSEDNLYFAWQEGMSSGQGMMLSAALVGKVVGNYCLRLVNYRDGDVEEIGYETYAQVEIHGIASVDDIPVTTGPVVDDVIAKIRDTLEKRNNYIEDKLKEGDPSVQNFIRGLAVVPQEGKEKIASLGTKKKPWGNVVTEALSSGVAEFTKSVRILEELVVQGGAQFGIATIKINPEEDTISFGDNAPGIIFGNGNDKTFTFYDAENEDDKEGQNSLIKIIDTGSTANLDISGGLIVNSGGTSEKMIVNNKNGRAVFSIITDQNLLGMGGKIGFGTDNPTTAIEAVSNKGLAPTFSSYNNNWWVAPGYILRKSLGTEANPIGVTGKTDDEGRQPEIPGRFMFQVNDRPAGEAVSWVDVAMVTSQLDGEVDLGTEEDPKRIVPGSLSFWVRSNKNSSSTQAMELALYINNQGNLGIGSWIPTVRLEVAQKDKEPQINLTRGDLARTTSISENDVIGTLAFRGDDKDIVEVADKLGDKTIFAKISGVAEANFVNDNAPGALIFSTGDPAAGNKPVTERMRIDSDGYVTIKPTNPEAMKEGYVLTAIDEDGKAEWKPAGDGNSSGNGSTNYWKRSDGNIYLATSTDEVGIGTTNPTSKLSLATSTAASGGIAFGSDTNLYRSAADMLRTDDGLIIGGQITIIDGSPGANKVLTSDADGLAEWKDPVGGEDNDWVIDGDNVYREGGYVGIGTTNPISKLSLATSTAASGGIAFGSDTNLYRSAAKTLKTDGKLIVDSLQIGNSTVNFGSDFLEFDTNPSEIRYNTKLSFENTAEGGKIPVTLDGNNITFNELKDCSVLKTDDGGKVFCGEAAGGFTSFNLVGDSGDEQEITDGNELTIVGGTGIDTLAENTDKLTISIKADSIDFTHLKDTLALDADTIINLSSKKLTIQGTSSVKSEFLANGDVKFGGNLEIIKQITIAGGDPEDGRVLTSNATGLATWKDPAGGHDAVTLGTDDYDYLSIDDQKITLGQLDISDDTNLTVEAPLAIAADGKLTITEDSIDFTHLKDTLALDADTIITLGDHNFNIKVDGDGELTIDGDLYVAGTIYVNGQELSSGSDIKIASFEFTFDVYNDNTEKIIVNLTPADSVSATCITATHCKSFINGTRSKAFDPNNNIIVSHSIVAVDLRTSFFNNTIIPEIKSSVDNGKVTINLIKKTTGLHEYGPAPYGTIKIKVSAFQF